MHFVITREKDEAANLAALFREAALPVVELPLIRREVLDTGEMSQVLEYLHERSAILLSSYFAWQCLKDNPSFLKLNREGIFIFTFNEKVVAEAAELLPQCGVGICPQKSGKALGGYYAKKHHEFQQCVFVGARVTAGMLEKELENNRVPFSYFALYETKQCEYTESELQEALADTQSLRFVFTSPSSVKSFLRLQAGVTQELLPCVSIGSTTSGELRNADIPYVEADEASELGIIKLSKSLI